MAPNERQALLPGLGRQGSVDAVWIPVTIHLPLGLAKSWTPTCAEFSIYTPLLLVIFFAQLAQTVLVPVLPFMVTQKGADPIYYGLLQSTYWVVELVSAPVLGSLSDRLGRRVIIFGSLVVSAVSHAVLALSPGIRTMFMARTLCGFGFQLALCRAYFAETGAKHSRASSFGLIGVITGAALTMGPSLGGIVGGDGRAENSAWFACILCSIAAVFALRWRPAEPVEKSLARAEPNRWVRIDLRKQESGEPPLDEHGHTPHHLEGGSAHKIKIGAQQGSASALVDAEGENDDSDADDHLPLTGGGKEGRDEDRGPAGQAVERELRARRRRKGWLCKAWRLNGWLVRQGVYPLLLLNTTFRFAFSVYKSSFAYFCAHTFGYGAAEVGYALSMMGLLGILVQGVLLRVVVRYAKDGNTLYVGLLSTALGLTMLAVSRSSAVLALSLALITTGYGLAVPSLSALFSHVPMQQGVMQGIAGSADRFGQAIGPIAGIKLLGVVGERGLMNLTGIGLFLICTVCVQFIRGSDGRAISTALLRGLWDQLIVLKVWLGISPPLPAVGSALHNGGSTPASGHMSSESSSDAPPGEAASMARSVSMREFEGGDHAHLPEQLHVSHLQSVNAIHRAHVKKTAVGKSGSLVVRNGVLDLYNSPFNTLEAQHIRLLRNRSNSF
mmetsp:Transcript_18073/g.48609  ORF Transcript_18073/g.48609 Transcript_18073/m.48609 type:complete len:669 (+) Transcript_18073:174-2180(+)